MPIHHSVTDHAIQWESCTPSPTVSGYLTCLGQWDMGGSDVCYLEEKP